MHMLRHHDMLHVDHEVLLTKEQAGPYEEEVRRIGIPVHKLPIVRGKRAWLKSFRSFLQAREDLAAVHSHLYLFSAAVLGEAKRAGVPVRIAHCHTARSRGSDRRSLRHRLRRALAIRWLRRVSSCRIGISEAAIEEIAGPRWRHDPSNVVLVYGFDFSSYAGAQQRSARLRKLLGIAEHDRVVGHVGRFDPVKNHQFLLEAFAAVLEHRQTARLVLVGDGPLRAEMMGRAERAGIGPQVHFAGTTDDVPAYMRMFDLFALPSFSEGLGIVCVEAQAAGTRAVVSESVAAEVAVVPGAVHFLPLDAGPEAWGRKMTELLDLHAPDRGEWLEQVKNSRFAIERCISELDGIYQSQFARSR
jgi:glycosyltransferase involved in cell wall biosynthesis